MSEKQRRVLERNTRKTYAQIVGHVRDAIFSGELRPGDRLPPETDLARRLGVSRPTVREALKVLEAQDVLQSSTGPTGGTFVRALDTTLVANHLKDYIRLLLDVEELTLEELYAAREAIEIPAAGLAALRRTETDLAAMKAVIESDGLKDSNALFSDISFHRAVVAASKNRMLSLFISSAHAAAGTLADRYVLPEAKQSSQRDHKLIYDAIRQGDQALASSRMKEHLSFAHTVYRKAIPKKGAQRVVDTFWTNTSARSG